MAAPSEATLYDRQVGTLVASWRAYARHSDGATVAEVEGAAVCLFPSAPESAIYNNALLPRGLGAAAADEVVAAVEATYREARIPTYAVWAHDSDLAAVTALERHGLRFDSATRAMAMSLEALTEPRPEVEQGDLDWAGYAAFEGIPDLLRGATAAEFHLRTARLDGREVGAVIAYDHDGDCGIFNLGTVPEARRRGIGSALTALQLHAARERGCTTASLQATPIAEGVYAALGFLDLGRHLEYTAAGREQGVYTAG
jgi:ribosomal protein S18 acetylase RimI-like enzyme